MRQIEITDGVSYNQTIGVIGEHRATELQITLPDDMTTDVDYWIAVFKSGTRTIESGIITSELSEDGNAIVTDGILYIKLWRELTLSPCLNLTVSAYKMDGDKAVLIASMPLIGDFYFSAANIEGETADTDAGGMAVDVATLKTDVDGLAADVTALAEDSHTHDNIIPISKLTENEAGNPLYGGKPIGGGGVTVVDYYDDLPDDAAEGDLAYVRLETESDDGAPLDLSDCPKGSDVSAEVAAAYIAQGGSVGDSGWDDFMQSYTNCNFPAGVLKLGTPIYRPVADIDAFFHVGLSLGTNYGERELLLVRPILFLVGSEVLQSEYTVFVPDSDYSYGYMSGCVPMGEAAAPEEFTENGITKYKMMVAYVYAFESLTGQLYNTGGMFDGLQINIARGWNSVELVMTEEFLPERVEILPQSDVYLPAYTFWMLSDIEDDEYKEIFARTAITDMLTDTTQSIIIPPALYIRADGEWRKTS